MTTIPSVTAAVAGVTVSGHVGFETADGSISLSQPRSFLREVPLYTDTRFLETLQAGIQSAGGRLKVRADHDDRISARVGMAVNFRTVGSALKCDLLVFRSSRHAPLILEIARADRENLSLSFDFDAHVEMVGGRAQMRANSVYALDVVDAGAVTPYGL